MDKRLLEILVCPANKTALIFDESKQELIAVSSGLAYPVRDGIPILLVDEARKMMLEESESYRKKQTV
jgi:uncharacterized protein YbaR (Trm112 family)